MRHSPWPPVRLLLLLSAAATLGVGTGSTAACTNLGQHGEASSTWISVVSAAHFGNSGGGAFVEAVCTFSAAADQRRCIWSPLWYGGQPKRRIANSGAVPANLGSRTVQPALVLQDLVHSRFAGSKGQVESVSPRPPERVTGLAGGSPAWDSSNACDTRNIVATCQWVPVLSALAHLVGRVCVVLENAVDGVLLVLDASPYRSL
ncbi:hypothetical protein AK812_SmicGene28096 [Symbiodinium microadriaticum]|uniref:Uncharacterized protein n=1 Tax=Symbiodinium microadriaticum TaxID=2951 RepID=A0A1Q9D5J2_SYMMI|nr:hypothetical protein AK812_SmicGene28096 [Symbiodinium microadriaticum]